MASRTEDDPELRRAVLELQQNRRIEENSKLLFEHFYPWVRRFFARFGYSPQDCEDLAQDVLFQVLRQIGSFRSDGSFKSWLFATASNLHRNEQRRRHREKRSGHEVSIDEKTESGAPLIEPVAAGVSPARAAFERQRREALAKAVAELPPQMRRVIILRVDQDLKYREIAEVLQISIETVKAHLFTARQRLRELLGEDFGDLLE
jgi:RNA polymerase sigma-70 factor (ECF subfamily)